MRYIIHTHYENSKGEVQDWYTGREDYSLSKMNEYPSTYQIIEYGFSNKASAIKALKVAQEGAKMETNYGSWKVTAELEEITTKADVIEQFEQFAKKLNFDAIDLTDTAKEQAKKLFFDAIDVLYENKA